MASDGDGSRMTSAVSAIERRLTFAWTTCMTEDKTETGAKKAKRYLVNFHILILSLNSKCYRISPDTHPARGCRCTGHEFNQLSHRCMGVRPEKRVGIFFFIPVRFCFTGTAIVTSTQLRPALKHPCDEETHIGNLVLSYLVHVAM